MRRMKPETAYWLATALAYLPGIVSQIAGIAVIL
jgi:hypothetical protein